MKLYIVIETLDGDPSINLVTADQQKARQRLYDCAVGNEVADAGEKEKKKVLAGNIVAYRDNLNDSDCADHYQVDLLEAELDKENFREGLV